MESLAFVELDEKKGKALEFSADLIKRCKDLDILNVVELEIAGEFSQRAKDEIKDLEKAFKPLKDDAFKSHREICKDETEAVAPFKEVLTILRPKIIKYQNDLAEKALKIKQDAEKKQREIEAEAKRKAQEERDKHTETLLDSGDDKVAEIIMDAPLIVDVPAIVPAPEPEKKVKGLGLRKTWKGRVIDFSKVDDRFKMINQKAVDQMAKICEKKSTESGLEFYEDTGLSGR